MNSNGLCNNVHTPYQRSFSVSSIYFEPEQNTNIYRKILKIRIPNKFAVTVLKFEQGGFTKKVMYPEDANSVDPDQTAV